MTRRQRVNDQMKPVVRRRLSWCQAGVRQDAVGGDGGDAVL